MINSAPGFWTIFGPLGPTAGHGSPGNGPGSKNSAGSTKNQPRSPILSAIRGHFVFLVDRKASLGCMALGGCVAGLVSWGSVADRGSAGTL